MTYPDALGNYDDVIFLGLIQKQIREMNCKNGHIGNTPTYENYRESSAQKIGTRISKTQID